MGRHHLRALERAPFFDLAGLCDLSAERLATESLPGWASLEHALSAAHPDAALLAVPPHAHESCARLCLGHGIPVLLEKPLTPTLAASTALVQDFETRKTGFQPAMVERFNPAWLAFLEHRHRLGTLRMFDIRRLGNGTRPAHAIDVGLDLAIHDLDLLAQLHPALHPQEIRRSEGVLQMHMTSPDGCDVRVQARWNAIEPQRRWTIEGDGGRMELDFQARTARLEGRVLSAPGQDPLQAQLRSFAAALDGRTDTGTDTALLAQGWLEAPTNATASISTFTSRGKRPTSMVERAGA